MSFHIFNIIFLCSLPVGLSTCHLAASALSTALIFCTCPDCLSWNFPIERSVLEAGSNLVIVALQ